jgi:hypothetical protein
MNLIKLTYIPLTLYPRRDSKYITDIPPRRQNDLAMRNTADVTGGKSIAVFLRCIFCWSFSRLLRDHWKKGILGSILLSWAPQETY